MAQALPTRARALQPGSRTWCPPLFSNNGSLSPLSLCPVLTRLRRTALRLTAGQKCKVRKVGRVLPPPQLGWGPRRPWCRPVCREAGCIRCACCWRAGYCWIGPLRAPSPLSLVNTSHLTQGHDVPPEAAPVWGQLTRKNKDLVSGLPLEQRGCRPASGTLVGSAKAPLWWRRRASPVPPGLPSLLQESL